MTLYVLFPKKDRRHEHHNGSGDQEISRQHPPAANGCWTVRREDWMSIPADDKADHRRQRQEYVQAGQQESEDPIKRISGEDKEKHQTNTKQKVSKDIEQGCQQKEKGYNGYG